MKCMLRSEFSQSQCILMKGGFDLFSNKTDDHTVLKQSIICHAYTFKFIYNIITLCSVHESKSAVMLPWLALVSVQLLGLVE